MNIDKSIFKAYDIRGIVDKTLTESACQAIGFALGNMAKEKNVTKMSVGRDGRLSGERLSKALIYGICQAGIEVIDIDMVATPMLYFAAHTLSQSTGVMITGSHNPPEYNGLKIMVAGVTLYGDTIQSIYQQINQPEFTIPNTDLHAYQTHDIFPAYQAKMVADIKLSRPIKVVVDCGNGSPGAYAPSVLRALGCDVVELFCDVDGNFPNHHPDPAHPENLQDVINTLKTNDAELGLAFDGDGDRLGVVTKDGQIIYPDRQLMLFAKDVLNNYPNAEIIYDVKCSRHVGNTIRQAGGKPLMWRTGHSLIKAKLKETNAPLAGEMSGHIFFNDRWSGFDDGIYAAARLLEILTRSDNPSQVLNDLPNAYNTPELHIHCAEGEHFALIETLRQQTFAKAKEIITIDGVRAEYEQGFGLARASNTTPVVVLRFEGDSPEALAQIQQEFRGILQRIAPHLALPF